MEMHIPNVVTAETQMTERQAELAHLLVPSSLNGNRVALLLQKPPQLIKDKYKNVLAQHPEMKGLPLLSIPLHDEMLRIYKTSPSRRTQASTMRIDDEVEALAYTFRLGSEGASLLFDLTDPTTNDFFQRCGKTGQVPTLLRGRDRILITTLPLPKELMPYIAAAASSPQRSDVTAFERLADAVNHNALKDQIGSTTPLLVASPQTLPAALGLQQQPLTFGGAPHRYRRNRAGVA